MDRKGPPLAPHVQAALRAAVQPRSAGGQARPLAAHVAAAVAGRPVQPAISPAAAQPYRIQPPPLRPLAPPLAPPPVPAPLVRPEVAQPKASPVQAPVVARPGGAAPPVHPVLQRQIKYSSPSKSFGVDRIRNREELIAAIRSKFRLLSLSAVTALVDQIEAQDEVWTLHEVYRICAQRNKDAPVPLSTSEQTGDIRLPSQDAHRNDFGFTTRTRLSGKIKRKKKKRQVPLPESTQKSDTWHAEDDLMRHLDGLLEREEVDPENDEIVITINNSPCLARCAANLSAWKRKHWRGRIVIYFANPHGSEEEYIAARQMLRLAGIEIHSFEPLFFISANSLDVNQKKRFLAMKDRRKRYRKSWNEEHPSDLSSDTEGEEEKKKKEPRAPKPKKKRRLEGSEPGTSTSTAPRRPVRQGHVMGLPGTRANVSGNGMSCLIRALLRALGLQNGGWVQPIRAHIDQNAGALPGTMLELAGVAGAVLISFLVQQGALPADRGVDVYMPDDVHGGYQRFTVVAGHNPVRLYLEDEHFEAIV